MPWVAWMPREELIRKYGDFDLFVFPSLHDSGGMAVLEALSFGLPVVCLDLGGPGIAVNNECGRVISTAGVTERQVVDRIAQFLTQVLDYRTMLHGMSEAAGKRAAMLSWQSNVNSVYGEPLVPRQSQLEGVSSVHP